MSAVPNQKEIILNCMPPSTVGSPSAALSILKAYLCKHGYSVRVIYWNILLYNLENEFTWNKCHNVQGASTLIYAAYLAVKNGNKSLYNEVKAALQTILPVMLNEKGFFDKHIEQYALKLEQFIDSYLDGIDFKNVLYFGFSVNMNQWILASVVAEIVKKREGNMLTVIGGINSAEVAKAFLDNFKQFDIAILGEGEIPLEETTLFLSNHNNFSEFNVERAFYRENGVVKGSSSRKHNFYDLSSNDIYPEFGDFFEHRNQLGITTPINYLVFEGGRGCHWNRCHFCYLNKGYKYRQKSIDKISKEIKYMISTYGIFRFCFTDCDIIGNDMNRFCALLDELTKIKNEYENFTIVGAEVITLDLSCSTIKKMAEAGIELIQVGFESASNNLLKKIDKKNTFASNINTIKHCFDVGVFPGGINILYNLLEETEEDIYESVENLRFLRFLLDEKRGFKLVPVTLKANSISKYYNAISDNQGYVPIMNLYHKAFINVFNEESKWHFYEFSLNYRDAKWDYFTDMHFHYTNNNYKYKFTYKDDEILFQEFLNSELIEHIEFERNELYISILDYCYDKPVTINELQNKFSEKDRIFPDLKTLVEKIDTLFYQGLLYRTPDYNEIVSIVNVKKQEL